LEAYDEVERLLTYQTPLFLETSSSQKKFIIPKCALKTMIMFLFEYKSAFESTDQRIYKVSCIDDHDEEDWKFAFEVISPLRKDVDTHQPANTENHDGSSTTKARFRSNAEDMKKILDLMATKLWGQPFDYSKEEIDDSYCIERAEIYFPNNFISSQPPNENLSLVSSYQPWVFITQRIPESPSRLELRSKLNKLLVPIELVPIENLSLRNNNTNFNVVFISEQLVMSIMKSVIPTASTPLSRMRDESPSTTDSSESNRILSSSDNSTKSNSDNNFNNTAFAAAANISSLTSSRANNHNIGLQQLVQLKDMAAYLVVITDRPTTLRDIQINYPLFNIRKTIYSEKASIQYLFSFVQEVCTDLRKSDAEPSSRSLTVRGNNSSRVSNNTNTAGNSSVMVANPPISNMNPGSIMVDTVLYQNSNNVDRNVSTILSNPASKLASPTGNMTAGFSSASNNDNALNTTTSEPLLITCAALYNQLEYTIQILESQRTTNQSLVYKDLLRDRMQNIRDDSTRIESLKGVKDAFSLASEAKIPVYMDDNNMFSPNVIKYLPASKR
jgi:hypothetical protein